uniref:Uncharacterized protein n=1 Tax=Ditylenchus dipsaci TaxID=166011 RepID=A0A915EFE6_9BILA
MDNCSAEQALLEEVVEESYVESIPSFENVPVSAEDELQLHDDEGTAQRNRKRHYYDAATKLEAVNWASQSDFDTVASPYNGPPEDLPHVSVISRVFVTTVPHNNPEPFGNRPQRPME